VAYFALGAYHNYSTYGATGWDMIPHRDMWRDLPWVVSDLVRRKTASLLFFLYAKHISLSFFRVEQREVEVEQVTLHLGSSLVAQYSFHHIQVAVCPFKRACRSREKSSGISTCEKGRSEN